MITSSNINNVPPVAEDDGDENHSSYISEPSMDRSISNQSREEIDTNTQNIKKKNNFPRLVRIERRSNVER